MIWKFDIVKYTNIDIEYQKIYSDTRRFTLYS